jgi:hypothetical protein
VNKQIFDSTYKSLIENKIKVNNEFYVDSMIMCALQNGCIVKSFNVDSFICWGTPDELDTFNYWQDCFDGWRGHDYRKLNDVVLK